jgi:hypothetical protein
MTDLNNATFAEIIAALAGKFEMPAVTRKGDYYNGMGWQQKNVLEQLCQNAHFMLGSATRFADEQAEVTNQLVDTQDGTELNILQLDAQLDKMENARTRVTILEDFSNAALNAYAAIVGEEFKPRETVSKAKPSVTDPEAIKRSLARAAALGVKINVAAPAERGIDAKNEQHGKARSRAA